MRPVATTEEMRLIDSVTIEGDGLAGAALMENAGRGVVREMLTRFPDLGPGDVVVVVGKGNNGGDGLVIARHLAGAGVEPLVFSVGDPAELTGDALANWNVLRAGGRGVWVIEGEDDVVELARALENAVIAVDALLGTGVSGEPRGLFAPVIRTLNDGSAFVVAVDVPSGLDSTTGAAELAVQADLTVTLACPKTGLFLPPGYLLTGEVVTAPIGVNPEWFAGLRTFLAEPGDVAPYFEPLPPDTHKGGRGTVNVLAGCRDYSGAAGLACLAACRTGAGLVNLCATASTLLLVKPAMLGVTSTELPDEAGFVTHYGAQPALTQLNSGDAAVVGPGLGADECVGRTLEAVLPGVRVPLVVDADGLNTTGLDVLKRVQALLVITPHPGEAGRLLGSSAAEVNADRLGAARGLAVEVGGVCLLKGYRTVVAAADGTACFIPTGDWRMAVGGSGDVLAGIIGALLARGVEPFSAAVAGAYLHGSAGESAAESVGDWSVSPEDILEAIPEAVEAVLGGEG
jgi:hydroxyethylthiazole kinase-like uncharacterized protein yjeF